MDRVTVRELIEVLKQLPQDVRVMVRGYEWGAEDLKRVRLTKVAPNGMGDTGGSYGYGGDWDYDEGDEEAVLMDRET